MERLDQITLVVPTYRRRPFLARLAYFYRDFPIHLIIADGTEGEPWAEAKLMGPNMHYFHQPGESFLKRINQATQMVETPFCAWLGDDEFQLPTGLAYSAEILAENKSAATAIGACVGFNVIQNVAVGGNIYNYIPKIFSTNLPKRIEDYFLHYLPTIDYSLWRSQQLKEATLLATYRDWGSGNVAEWVKAFCGLCFGNHIIHGHVQWLRSDENPPQQAQHDRAVGIIQWYTESKFEDERHALTHKLLGFVKSVDPYGNRFALSLIRMAFDFTIFGDIHNKDLQLLNLKPTKNYRRIYSQELSKVLKAGNTNIISELEITKIIQSIMMPYNNIQDL